MHDDEILNLMSREFETELLKTYGPLITGEPLTQALGYKSSAALNRAAKKGEIPFQLFDIEYRRGKFAFTKDVARWLATIRMNTLNSGMRM